MKFWINSNIKKGFSIIPGDIKEDYVCVKRYDNVHFMEKGQLEVVFSLDEYESINFH